MTSRLLIPAVVVVAVFAAVRIPVTAQTSALAAPHFHHIHLNSTNPDAAMAFYMKEFANISKTTWAGMPALKVPTNVFVVFNKVAAPAAANAEETADVWHFGWAVTDIRKKLEFYQAQPDVKVMPQYTGDDSPMVIINSDTIAGTKAEVVAAKAAGKKPAGGAGVFYIGAPDNALVENSGNQAVERINHVHMYQQEPFCAQIWYQKHLSAVVARPPDPPRTEENCKVARGEKSFPALLKDGLYRVPTAGVAFDDVAMNWYVTQLDKPLASSKSHLMDHVALSVDNLDAWVAKLRGEGVRFLQEPHKLGDTRAVMIEGPSNEQIEIVEEKK